jgi:hypothetical protein
MLGTLQALELPSRGTLYKIDGQRRIVAPVENAVATDAIGVGLAAILFLSTDSLILKSIAMAGGAWMIVALGGKILTLAKGPAGTLTEKERTFV